MCVRLDRVRWTLCQHLLQLLVVAVQVVEEVRLPILCGDAGQVENHDRERRLQIHLVVVRPAGHHVVDGFRVPAFTRRRGRVAVGQHPHGQVLRLLHADAAVREVAPRTAEQLRLRRGVQVDVVLVGEHELDQAQRVLRARLLPHLQAAVLHIFRRKAGQHIALAVHHLKVLLRQVAYAAGADVRHQLLLHNVVRHAPVRAKDQVLHHVGKHRGVVVAHHLAIHHAHGEVELVLRVVAAQDKLRQIHHQRRVHVLVGQPAPALQRVLQLDHALGQRHIQALHRVLGQPAVLGQSVPVLVVLDRGGQVGGIDRR